MKRDPGGGGDKIADWGEGRKRVGGTCPPQFIC